MIQTVHNVSVIICAYAQERWNILHKAIASVQQQAPPPSEIIVVIDHNLPLLERVREQISGVIAIENAEARGLSGARNSGIAAAKGEVIVFLDDDAVVTPGWLTLLCEEFVAPQVLGVGGAILPLWPTSAPGWFPEEFYWVVGCTYRGMPSMKAAVRNLIGANMSFRREIFQAVGGFRHGIGRVGTLPVGCEETELCIRVRQRWPQGVFQYQPQARVLHYVPESRTHWRYFWTRCYAEGLSKAIVAGYVGTKDGLASERVYTLRVLPQGVIRGLMDTILHGNLAGIMRAGAIIVGLAATTLGYLAGRISPLMAKPKATRS